MYLHRKETAIVRGEIIFSQQIIFENEEKPDGREEIMLYRCEDEQGYSALGCVEGRWSLEAYRLGDVGNTLRRYNLPINTNIASPKEALLCMEGSGVTLGAPVMESGYDSAESRFYCKIINSNGTRATLTAEVGREGVEFMIDGKKCGKPYENQQGINCLRAGGKEYAVNFNPTLNLIDRFFPTGN